MKHALLFVALLTACGSGDAGPSAERGRGVYLANCTACHNPDPTRNGMLGPAVAGSSRELIEARVVQGGYPPGYTAKVDTKLMAPLPFLAGEVDALTAYLSSAGSTR